MRSCSRCGGRLHRIHRRFWEKFVYLAVYECDKCKHTLQIAHPLVYHFGKNCRCPVCGTHRVTRLKELDVIDPVKGGFLNFLERLAEGNLYHCRFCRVQFYDRRSLATVETAKPAAAGQ